jgi:hypothetical protein
MFTFETSDQKEVRRFRIAQFNGRTATVRSAGSAVTGHVRSIVENKSSVPAAWTITIIPEEPKPTLLLRPATARAHLHGRFVLNGRNARSGAFSVSMKSNGARGFLI